MGAEQSGQFLILFFSCFLLWLPQIRESNRCGSIDGFSVTNKICCQATLAVLFSLKVTQTVAQWQLLAEPGWAISQVVRTVTPGGKICPCNWEGTYSLAWVSVSLIFNSCSSQPHTHWDLEGWQQMGLADYFLLLHFRPTRDLFQDNLWNAILF